MVDLIIYYTLSEFFNLDTKVSKACSFMVGTVYTYYLNKLWTWRHTEKSNKGMLLTFVLIYAVSLVLNVFLNDFCLNNIQKFTVNLNIFTNQKSIDLFSFKGEKFLGFFFATLGSAVLNFVGQKYFVFKTVKLDPKDETNIEVF